MAGSKHSGNGHDGHHVTETPDVSHIKNLDVTHEASDVSVSGILKFVFGLTALTVAVFLLMWGMFHFLNAQETGKEPPAGPMAMTEQERLPPEPRLQAARGFGVKLEDGKYVDLEKREPEAEYRVLHEQWERRLNCKRDDLPPGTIDDKPLNCLPINWAIDLLFTSKGLPTRAPASNSGKLVETAPPSAWSSGRVSGKAGQ